MGVVIYTNGSGRGHVTRAAALARRFYDAVVLHTEEYDEPLEWAGVEHYRVHRQKADLHDWYMRGFTPMFDGTHFFRAGQRGMRRGHDMERFPVILPFRHEILSREDAKAALGIVDDRPVLLALHDLYEDSVSKFAALAGGWNVVTSPPYPAALYMRAADAVLGNAGYNLYWETRLIGVPAFLQPALNTTDQLLRARPKSAADFVSFLGASRPCR